MQRRRTSTALAAANSPHRSVGSGTRWRAVVSLPLLLRLLLLTAFSLPFCQLVSLLPLLLCSSSFYSLFNMSVQASAPAAAHLNTFSSSLFSAAAVWSVFWSSATAVFAVSASVFLPSSSFTSICSDHRPSIYRSGGDGGGALPPHLNEWMVTATQKQSEQASKGNQSTLLSFCLPAFSLSFAVCRAVNECCWWWWSCSILSLSLQTGKTDFDYQLMCLTMCPPSQQQYFLIMSFPTFSSFSFSSSSPVTSWW